MWRELIQYQAQDSLMIRESCDSIGRLRRRAGLDSGSGNYLYVERYAVNTAAADSPQRDGHGLGRRGLGGCERQGCGTADQCRLTDNCSNSAGQACRTESYRT